MSFSLPELSSFVVTSINSDSEGQWHGMIERNGRPNADVAGLDILVLFGATFDEISPSAGLKKPHYRILVLQRALNTGSQ